MSSNELLETPQAKNTKKVAIIKDVEYAITPDLYRMMRYFSESEAI